MLCFSGFALLSGWVPLMKENIKIKTVVRALKTKQIGNVFSLHGCQENDHEALVKYSNGKVKRPLKFCI